MKFARKRRSDLLRRLLRAVYNRGFKDGHRVAEDAADDDLFRAWF